MLKPAVPVTKLHTFENQLGVQAPVVFRDSAITVQDTNRISKFSLILEAILACHLLTSSVMMCNDDMSDFTMQIFVFTLVRFLHLSHLYDRLMGSFALMLFTLSRIIRPRMNPLRCPCRFVAKRRFPQIRRSIGHADTFLLKAFHLFLFAAYTFGSLLSEWTTEISRNLASNPELRKALLAFCSSALVRKRGGWCL